MADGNATNGSGPRPPAQQMVQPAPLPVSYQFDPVMIGDQKAYMLAFQTAAGHSWIFLDEKHATRLRDRITECISGLVLP